MFTGMLFAQGKMNRKHVNSISGLDAIFIEPARPKKCYKGERQIMNYGTHVGSRPLGGVH